MEHTQHGLVGQVPVGPVTVGCQRDKIQGHGLKVRQFLLELQRDLARKHDVIMDGRDIGTVVLPGAAVKIFLTADPKERAMRRYKELVAKGEPVEFDTVLREVEERDYNDSHRAVAPLCQAEDAWLCDTTGLTLEGSIQAVVDHVRQKSGVTG